MYGQPTLHRDSVHEKNWIKSNTRSKSGTKKAFDVQLSTHRHSVRINEFFYFLFCFSGRFLWSVCVWIIKSTEHTKIISGIRMSDHMIEKNRNDKYWFDQHKNQFDGKGATPTIPNSEHCVLRHSTKRKLNSHQCEKPNGRSSKWNANKNAVSQCGFRAYHQSLNFCNQNVHSTE